MASTRVETAVGGVVLAAAIGFAVYGAQITGLRGAGDTTYDLTASFRSLEGVNVGTDVRLAGVKIGSVTDIALDPQTYRAVTTVTLGTQTQIPDDSAIVISSEGLLGGNFVEVMPGGSPFYFEPGAEITDTQGAVSLVQLLLRFVAGDAQ